MTLWAAELPAWSPPPVPVAAEIRESGPEGARAIAAAMGPEADLVEARVARGCRCFAAWAGPQVLAYGWLTNRKEWIGELGIEIRPASGEAYVWNCVTLVEHRRQGLFTALLVHVAGKARQEGLGRLWIGSVEGTAESAVSYAGFAPVLRMSIRSVRGLRLLRTEPAREAGPHLVRAARSALSLRGRRSLRRSRLRRH